MEREEVDEQSVDIQNVDLDEFVVPDEDEPIETVDPGPQEEEPEETEETPEEIGKEVEETPDELTVLKGKLAKETKDKNVAFAKLRQTQKEQEISEPALTDSQLEAIIAEHKDDPAAMLKVNRYIAEQAAKSTKGETIDAIKLSETKSITDRYVAENYPQLLDESHETFGHATNLKDHLGIADHPHADYLVGNTLIAMTYRTEVESAYNRGLEEGQKKLTETIRKKDIKENKLESTSTQKKSAVVNTPATDTVANILGLKGRAKDGYVKMMAEANDGK